VLQVFCYSQVKTKEFSRTWSLCQAFQSLPVILGVAATGTRVYTDKKEEKNFPHI
jgi:hypothetical protein